MKIIVFSDIHGNIDALESFLELSDGMEYERVYNLGDTVGYGAGPNECVDMVRKRNISSVTGNHDDVIVGRRDPGRFNPDARRAILWTRNELREENKDWLRGLNDFIWMDSSLGKALLVHGSPVNKDEYVTSASNAEKAFVSMDEQDILICFVGHTHKACLWTQGMDGSPVFKPQAECDGDVKLEPTMKVIVNVGSIGQPRDGTPDGCFVVWDDVRHTVRFHRFTYPVERAQTRMKDAGLPGFIIERLGGGF